MIHKSKAFFILLGKSFVAEFYEAYEGNAWNGGGNAGNQNANEENGGEDQGNTGNRFGNKGVRRIRMKMQRNYKRGDNYLFSKNFPIFSILLHCRIYPFFLYY